MKTTLRITKHNEGIPNLELRNESFLLDDDEGHDVKPDDNAEINVVWSIHTYPKLNIKTDLFTSDDHAIVEVKPEKIEFLSRKITYYKKGKQVELNKIVEFEARVTEWKIDNYRDFNISEIKPKYVIIDCKYKIAQVYF